jgi:hypothetical protein
VPPLAGLRGHKPPIHSPLPHFVTRAAEKRTPVRISRQGSSRGGAEGRSLRLGERAATLATRRQAGDRPRTRKDGSSCLSWVRRLTDPRERLSAKDRRSLTQQTWPYPSPQQILGGRCGRDVEARQVASAVVTPGNTRAARVGAIAVGSRRPGRPGLVNSGIPMGNTLLGQRTRIRHRLQ